jgi:sortase A
METKPKAPGNRMNRALDIIGRIMIASGLLLLSFVGYQLWGTGIAESRAQSSLETEFREQLPALPKYGGLVGRIEIPSISVDKLIVAGVDAQALKKGPGLFPGSPLPGQFGNVSIAGHRTTYGAPFSRIDEIRPGDSIILETSKGTYTYIVSDTPRIVPATAVEVVATVDDTRGELTLVSCHPKWSAAKRIIVSADLESTVTPAPITVFDAPISKDIPLTEGWFHDPSVWPSVIALAIALSLIAFIAVWFVGRGQRRLIVYPLSAVVFLPTLYVFYENLSGLMPTNL